MEEAQPDEAALRGPIASGAMMGVLREVGLTGPKLALQVGSEEKLAKQVAERAGIACDDWVVDFIRGQVKAAYEAMELDVRVAGGSARPGIQAVHDAMAYAKKQKLEAAPSSSSTTRPELRVVLPKRGSKLKLMKPPRSMARLLEEEDVKITRILQEELIKMGAPVMERMKEVRDPGRAAMSLLEAPCFFSQEVPCLLATLPKMGREGDREKSHVWVAACRLLACP